MKKVLDFCELVMIYISAISTFLLVLLTTCDAGSRYLFNSPITGAYEITTNYLMTAAVFLSLCYGYRNGSFIRVTFLTRVMRGKVKYFVNYFVQVFSLLYGLILVYATYRQAVLTFEMNTKLSSVDFIPLGPAYIIIPAGLFFLSVLMLIDISNIRKNKSSLFTEEESPKPI